MGIDDVAWEVPKGLIDRGRTVLGRTVLGYTA